MDEAHSIAVEDKQGKFLHDLAPLFFGLLSIKCCYGNESMIISADTVQPALHVK